MHLQHLACFTAVAEHLHFGRAARQLLISPSSLSKRISELERELRVPLFERTTRQVRLTPAGVALLEPAQQVLTSAESVRSLAREAAAGRAGSIRAAYASGHGETMATLVRLLRNLDGSLVEVRLEQRTSAQVISGLRTGELSVGIARAAGQPADLVGLDRLVVERTRMDTLALPIDHPLAGSVELHSADLEDEVFLVPHPSIVGTVGGAQRGPLGVGRVRYEMISSEEEMIDRVATGIGIGLVDAKLAGRHPRGDIRFVRYVGPPNPPEASEFLFWREDDTSPVVARFVQLARRHVEVGATA